MTNPPVLHGLITSILGLNSITEIIFLEKFTSEATPGLTAKLSHFEDTDGEKQSMQLSRSMGSGHGGVRQVHFLLNREVCQIAFMFEPGQWYHIYLDKFSRIEDLEFIKVIQRYFADIDTDFFVQKNCHDFIKSIPFRLGA